MKSLALLLICMASFSISRAQLKTKVKCSDFYVDILNGTLNGLKPNRTQEEFKTTLPCYTSVEEEGSAAKCGSGVFFKDKYIYVYTKRKYIAVGPRFPVKQLSIPLMGAKRNALFKWLGNPKMKDDLWDAFDMQYGVLVLHYDVAGAAGKVKLIQFSTETTETLSLCE